MNAIAFAAAPFAVGSPTVIDVDDWTGGLHDGNPRGGPCVRFADAAAHWLNAGTIDARNGLALFGRGCAAPAI
jgi:hypothetical protein